MKKLKLMGLAMLFSLIMAGNILASGTVIATSTTVSSILSATVGYIASLINDNCPTRQCTNCRPDNEADGDNCRPPAD